MKWITVVVPAHNEEALLPHCLDAIEVAIAAVDIQVYVVVVLDSCTDRSHTIAASRPWVTVIETDARNVGVARSRGTAAALQWAAGEPLGDLWIATTDADSTVPADWLSRQLALAEHGWEVIIGTVSVINWSEHAPGTAPRWERNYHAIEHHPHVHGANLGFTAESYVASGGWPPFTVHEDVALVAAMSGRRTIRTATLPVTTSARREPRAVGGFGDAIRELAG